MSDYLVRVRRIRRQVILKFLSDIDAYTASITVLQVVLAGSEAGVPTTFDELLAELNWLRDQGMVTLSGGDFVVATATRRGVRVARGEDRHEGVERPLPGI